MTTTNTAPATLEIVKARIKELETELQAEKKRLNEARLEAAAEAPDAWAVLWVASEGEAIEAEAVPLLYGERVSRGEGEYTLCLHRNGEKVAGCTVTHPGMYEDERTSYLTLGQIVRRESHEEVFALFATKEEAMQLLQKLPSK